VRRSKRVPEFVAITIPGGKTVREMIIGTNYYKVRSGKDRTCIYIPGCHWNSTWNFTAIGGSYLAEVRLLIDPVIYFAGKNIPYNQWKVDMQVATS
jgi:hypothetical protein